MRMGDRITMVLFNFLPLLALPMLIATAVLLIATITLVQAGLVSARLL